jgi:hypothetical protein
MLCLLCLRVSEIEWDERVKRARELCPAFGDCWPLRFGTFRIESLGKRCVLYDASSLRSCDRSEIQLYIMRNLLSIAIIALNVSLASLLANMQDAPSTSKIEYRYRHPSSQSASYRPQYEGTHRPVDR